MIRSLLLVIVSLTLAACATPRHDDDTMVVSRDLGGMYLERLSTINGIALSGQTVEIKGTCASACTLFLTLEDNTCVHPRARLGFHGPQMYIQGRLINVPEPERTRVVKLVAAHYPPAFRAWFMDNAAHLSGEFVWMTGAEAIALGAKPCTT